LDWVFVLLNAPALLRVVLSKDIIAGLALFSTSAPVVFVSSSSLILNSNVFDA